MRLTGRRGASAAIAPSVLGAAAVVLLSACEPCAGTASCHGAPEISFTGQAIEHRTGAAVAGVRFAFVRRSGPALAHDTVRAVSGGNGYFLLREPAYWRGSVEGDLTVTPPAPYAAYTVPGLILNTNENRGDGGILGRVVVDPFLLLVGELRDRKTNDIVVGATVTMRRVSGARITPDTATFQTDNFGRFFLQPQVLDFANGSLIADFEIDVVGAPRKWLVRERQKIQFRDGGIRFVLLHAGRTLNYVAQVVRRAVWPPPAGTTVEVTRVGGIAVNPDRFTTGTDAYGGFAIRPEPLEDGDLVFDLTIHPPAPYPTQVVRGLRIATHDDDSTRVLGVFGYGAQATMRLHLVDRATGKPAPAGIVAQVRRKSGLAIETPLAADSGLRATDTTGVVDYFAPTADSGRVTFDVDVRLPSPLIQETIGGLDVRARYDSTVDAKGTFRIGAWVPATAQIVDDSTGTPLAGARVQFIRVSGIGVSPAVYQISSQADGSVRLALIPARPGEVVGILQVSAGAPYRDTTFVNVRLRTTQDDTLRSIGVYRIRRGP